MRGMDNNFETSLLDFHLLGPCNNHATDAYMFTTSYTQHRPPKHCPFHTGLWVLPSHILSLNRAP